MNDTIREQIILQCKALHLATSYADLAMTTKGETNQQYFLNVLTEKVRAKRAANIQSCLNNANFPYFEYPGNIDTSEILFPDDMSFEDCLNLKFYEERKNLMMYGNPGTGKTMITICVGLEACRRGIPVIFCRAQSLMTSLSEAHKAGTLTKLKDTLNKSEIILLDEFGYIASDITGSQLFFDFISEAQGKKVIVLNTNKEFSKWGNILYDDDMATALAGRIIQHCSLIVFPGEDRRLKNSDLMKAYEIVSKRKEEEELKKKQNAWAQQT